MKNLNQKGMATLVMILFVAAGMLFLFSTLLAASKSTSSQRSANRRQLVSQVIFENVAQLVYQSYLTFTATGACPGGTALITLNPEAVPLNLCLPITPESCIKNPNGGPNFCFTAANSNDDNLSLPNGLPWTFNTDPSPLFEKPEDYAGTAGRVFPMISLGLAQARAQSQALDLATLPKQADIDLVQSPVSPSTWGAFPVGCNQGVGDLICITARICLDGASCPDADAVYQKMGFTR